MAAALVVAGMLSGPGARADGPPLIGLFEGHGIAPPADRVRARTAIAGAQRLQSLCFAFYQHRGGGTINGNATCSGGVVDVARLGRDGAAALLDVMDEPRQIGSYLWETFPTLLDALARTGREDVVPVLITALDRLEARSDLQDERVREFGRFHWSSINAALTTLTYLELYEQKWSTGSSNDTIRPVAAGWRAWWEQNKSRPRAAWRADAILRARQVAKGEKVEIAVQAAIVLAETREAGAEGLSTLKQLVRSSRCADKCWDARSFLHRKEPRGHWLPPSPGN